MFVGNSDVSLYPVRSSVVNSGKMSERFAERGKLPTAGKPPTSSRNDHAEQGITVLTSQCHVSKLGELLKYLLGRARKGRQCQDLGSCIVVTVDILPDLFSRKVLSFPPCVKLKQ
jgi:hypothetical protein